MWPFKRETREADMTALLIQQLQSTASGENVEAGIAAIETAVGLWGRAFASARVEPENTVTQALTPGLLAMIGRALVTPGEAVLELEVDDGELVLSPIGTWSVVGGPMRSSWVYEATQHGPSGSYSRTLDASRVVHVQYSYEPSRPWDGRGPLKASSTTVALAKMIELRLQQEAGARVGTLLPVPAVDAGLQADINALAGKAVLVRSASNSWDQGGQPQRDEYLPRRLGMNPPPTLHELRGGLAEHVLAACGVPVELIEAGQGTASREAYRRFLHSTIAPVARIAAHEIGRKLDVEGLAFRFDALRASDVQGRARAVGSLVQAGMPLAQAEIVAGIGDAD